MFYFENKESTSIFDAEFMFELNNLVIDEDD